LSLDRWNRQDLLFLVVRETKLLHKVLFAYLFLLLYIRCFLLRQLVLFLVREQESFDFVVNLLFTFGLYYDFLGFDLLLVLFRKNRHQRWVSLQMFYRT
jgi:hypothetical protein